MRLEVTFRGGLVFQAHRLVYHSALGLRVVKKKKRIERGTRMGWKEVIVGIEGQYLIVGTEGKYPIVGVDQGEPSAQTRCGQVNGTRINPHCNGTRCKVFTVDTNLVFL